MQSSELRQPRAAVPRFVLICFTSSPSLFCSLTGWSMTWNCCRGCWTAAVMKTKWWMRTPTLGSCASGLTPFVTMTSNTWSHLILLQSWSRRYFFPVWCFLCLIIAFKKKNCIYVWCKLCWVHSRTLVILSSEVLKGNHDYRFHGCAWVRIYFVASSNVPSDISCLCWA